MADLIFQQLPVEADQGLPQAFSCPIGASTYEFGVYASVNAGETDPPETIYELGPGGPAVRPTSPDGFLVLRAVRRTALGSAVVLQRKLVAEPDLIHYTGELAIRCTEARVARGNLNAAGHYGTSIAIGVAQRWA